MVTVSFCIYIALAVTFSRTRQYIVLIIFVRNIYYFVTIGKYVIMHSKLSVWLGPTQYLVILGTSTLYCL